MKAYLTASINNSATLAIKAGAEIADVRFKAVKLDENGKAVLASVAGEAFLGIAIPTTGNAEGKVATGDIVDIQIKDIGMAMAGAAVEAGKPLTTDANGKLVAAASGNFIIGYALTAAAADGDIISVQVAKGYYPTVA